MSYTIPSDAYLIKTLADLPAPVGGIIELPEDRVILVDKAGPALAIPADTQLRVPSTSVLRGWDADLNGLQGDVDAPLVIGAGDGLVVTDLFLRNFNAGPDAFCVETENGFPAITNGRASRIERVSVGGTSGVRVRDATAVVVNVLSRCTQDGIVLTGETAGVQLVECVGVPAITDSPRHIVFDGGTHTSIRISDAALTLTDGSVGIQAVNDPTLALVRVGDTDFIPFPAGGVPGVPLAGNIAPGVPLAPDTQTDVLFLSNFGAPDSSFGGAMAIPNNATQITDILTAGVSTFVRVGNNNAAHPLYVPQSPSARFQVVGATAETQALVYTGPEPVTVTADAVASIRQAGIFQLVASMRIVHVPVSTGIPVPQQAFDTVLADGFSGGGATGELNASAPRLNLSPGDQLYVEIANRTNAPPLNPLVNLIVTSIALSFTPS